MISIPIGGSDTVYLVEQYIYYYISTIGETLAKSFYVLKVQ